MWSRLNWSNLASLRVWFGILIAGAILGGLAGKLWKPLTVPFFILGSLGSLTIWLTIGGNVYCPQCRKRVKMGANVCHHCGASAM